MFSHYVGTCVLTRATIIEMNVLGTKNAISILVTKLKQGSLRVCYFMMFKFLIIKPDIKLTHSLIHLYPVLQPSPCSLYRSFYRFLNDHQLGFCEINLPNLNNFTMYVNLLYKVNIL